MANKREKRREYIDEIYNNPQKGKLQRDPRTIKRQVKNTTFNHIHELSALFQAQGAVCAASKVWQKLSTVPFYNPCRSSLYLLYQVTPLLVWIKTYLFCCFVVLGDCNHLAST